MERNHSRAEGVWLVSFKKAADQPYVGYDEAVEEALCFGWIDSKRNSPVCETRHSGMDCQRQKSRDPGQARRRNCQAGRREYPGQPVAAVNTMKKLSLEEYNRVRELFHPWAYRPLAEAVIAGSSPGEIYVDRPDRPAVVLMATVEQYLLAGDPANEAGRAGLKALLAEIIASRSPFLAGADGLFISVYPENWTHLLDEVYSRAGRPRLVDKRHHYRCSQAAFDWQSHLPEGYTVGRVEADLLAQPGLVWAEPLSAWHAHELAFHARQGQTMVCWCPTVCQCDDRCEVGIEVAAAHRRRGLATATAAAFVEYCLSNGFVSVGWDCSDYNEASWRTARRAGFQPIAADKQHYCMFDEAFHWTETGWLAFRDERYLEAAAAYEKAFALKPDASAESYHEAAVACRKVGDQAKAGAYQHAAVERGFDSRCATQPTS